MQEPVKHAPGTGGIFRKAAILSRAEARSVQAVELRYWVAKRMQSRTRLSNACSGASCATCMAAVVNGEVGHDTKVSPISASTACAVQPVAVGVEPSNLRSQLKSARVVGRAPAVSRTDLARSR